jgi:oxygen-independent coproporphyrinogen-3 oxidase
VRPLTGLGRTSHLGNESAQRSQWDHQRRQLYRVARDYLRTRGYRQVSMRMFASPAAPHVDSPAYCCQSDGMIGLGCGARSYTDTLHYSFEYAVGAAEVRRILRDYLNRDTASFRQIEFGYELDLDDRQRRFLILSLLQCEGMKRSAYFDQFGTDPLVDFPNLALLSEHGLLEIQPHALRLTETGIEHSDAIGPWLNSPKVQQRIEQ